MNAEDERGQREKQSPASLDFLRLSEYTDDYLLKTDVELTIREASESCDMLLGMDSAKCIGNSIGEYIHPLEREGVLQQLSRKFADGSEALKIRCTHVSHMGEVRHVRWQVHARDAGSDGVKELFWLGTDISEFYSANDMAKMQEIALDEMAEMVILHDSAGEHHVCE